MATLDVDSIDAETLQDYEELFIAASKGLKVKEVPITIRYKGLHSTSKKHFILHGFELVIYIIKYAYNKRFKSGK